MFDKISKGGVGQVVLLIEFVLHLAGIELPEGSVLSAVNACVILAGIVLSVWSQFSRKDLVAGLFRKG